MSIKDRGLEELALAIALDLEPVDPPDSLEDKILSKIKAEEAPESSAKPSPPESGATPPDGGTSPQYQSDTTLTQ